MPSTVIHSSSAYASDVLRNRLKELRVLRQSFRQQTKAKNEKEIILSQVESLLIDELKERYRDLTIHANFVETVQGGFRGSFFVYSSKSGFPVICEVNANGDIEVTKGEATPMDKSSREWISEKKNSTPDNNPIEYDSYVAKFESILRTIYPSSSFEVVWYSYDIDERLAELEFLVSTDCSSLTVDGLVYEDDVYIEAQTLSN